MKCSNDRSLLLIDLGIIGGAWLIILISFFAMGRAGYGTGLAVATMGEDQNWIALLQENTAHKIAYNFWQIDGRNPLSPWFYIVARPIIMSFASGLAFLQYGVGLLLAFATYGLLRLLTGRDGRRFALFTSTIVAVNQANAYFDHIIWNFQIALCFTILSIAFYLIYLRAERRFLPTYGISLCFWCLSIFTYTLQSGAIAAIFCCQISYLCALFWKSPSRLSICRLKSHILVLSDIVPYLVIFIIFLLTWVTTTRADSSFSYTFSFKRMLLSLRAGLFHKDIELMFQVAKLSPFAKPYMVISAFLGSVLTLLIARSAPPLRDVKAIRYVSIIILVLAIALPTVLVESGGADWPPGSRWRMIYQMSTPVLFLSMVGGALSFLRFRFSHLIFVAISGSTLFFSLAFSFVYNERQVSLSRSEALVRETMHEVMAERRSHDENGTLLFVLEMDDSFHWLASETLRSVYMKTWFPGVPVDYRVLASARHVASNPTMLGFDLQAINVAGTSEKYPYDSVVILHASGASVTRLFSISRKDVTAHNGIWQNSSDKIDFR